VESAPEDDAWAQAAADAPPATLPMPMGLEKAKARQLAMPSMRATLPMPIEVPKDLEYFLAATSEPPVLLEGVRLDDVDAFDGLPRAALEALAAKAEIVELGADEEVAGFGAALLLAGAAVLCATIVDAAAHWARTSELLVARGSLADGIAVRVVGASGGATVAVWSRAVVEETFIAHPSVQARTRARGDRLQALAGATMGAFGEIADDDRRELVEELSVRCLGPGEIWLEDGAPVPAIALVGGGEIEIYGPISEETSETIEPGGLLFRDLCGVGGEANASARAGEHGALILVAERKSAERMCARVPDLAERLRG
jgi:hypothetical protein